MSHIAVVYWSGTGHTEAMAQKVAEGIISAGGEATVLTASEFNVSMMDSYDAVAFGCPSMGAEQLEESEFEPMFQECTSKLNGKKIAPFPEKHWAFSAPTDGETVNGCVLGKRTVKAMEPFSLLIP